MYVFSVQTYFKIHKLFVVGKINDKYRALKHTFPRKQPKLNDSVDDSVSEHLPTRYFNQNRRLEASSLNAESYYNPQVNCILVKISAM